MTAAEFRRIALSMPQATENAHMDHPDFRVDGKIFATLGYPDKHHGMVIRPLEEQERLIRTQSRALCRQGEPGENVVVQLFASRPSMR